MQERAAAGWPLSPDEKAGNAEQEQQEAAADTDKQGGAEGAKTAL